MALSGDQLGVYGLNNGQNVMTSQFVNDQIVKGGRRHGQ
jgi:hypothetical protein